LGLFDCGLRILDCGLPVLSASGGIEFIHQSLSGQVGAATENGRSTKSDSHSCYGGLKYDIAVNNSLDSGFDSAGLRLPPVFCNMAK